MAVGYLDMPSGISGDMLLGCLVSAGWKIDQLRATINQLALPPNAIRIECETASRNGFAGVQARVIANEPSPPHRHLRHIRELIDASDLPDEVRSRANAVFERLAHAEAKVHGTTVERVHFHEVGALDAIADIVGACAGLHALNIDRLGASPLPLGDGWVNTAHGRMPLPGPATLEILAAVNAPTRPAPGPGELVTPTGAALVAEWARFGQPVMSIRCIGVGIGASEFEWPNIARLWVGDATSPGPLVQIDTNIDDMNPQVVAAVRDNVMSAGALDMWYTPIQMKKGRPAMMVSVLAPASAEEAVAQVLLRETTTLGMRVHPVRRQTARQSVETIETPYGLISFKLKWLDDELAAAVPEFEDCRTRAEEHGVPTREVLEAASAAAYRFRTQRSSR